MPKDSPNRLRIVEAEKVDVCPKCSRKNEKNADRCSECGFPMKDAILTKVIPIQFLLKRR